MTGQFVRRRRISYLDTQGLVGCCSGSYPIEITNFPFRVEKVLHLALYEYCWTRPATTTFAHSWQFLWSFAQKMLLDQPLLPHDQCGVEQLGLANIQTANYRVTKRELTIALRKQARNTANHLFLSKNAHRFTQNPPHT